MLTRSIAVLFTALAFIFSYQSAVFARDGDAETEDLKRRVEELEKRVEGEEAVSEPGHKLHPIHSLYGLKISGGITLSAHGVSKIRNADNKGAGAASADLALESPVGENGMAVLVLDFERGAGISNLPAFFAAPNGNSTGYNADLESFDDDQVHLTQFYYEHNFSDRVFVTVGQLDPTGYFDANDLANDERAQFLANVFVNNPTIEWGGSADFYGPGVRATWFPVEDFDLTIGVFEGNGDYADSFDNPFVMVEANLSLDLFGRGGNYRVYYWNRQGRDGITDAATPTDAGLLEAGNQGVGVSLDQGLTDNIAVWFRGGVQREKVAQFDRFVGFGANLSGAVFGRPRDHAGFGYAATFMGKDYEEYLKTSTPSFSAEAEHYMEAYYSYAAGNATDSTGLHITPDLQYIINPGGDNDASNVFLYGVRMQVYF